MLHQGRMILMQLHMYERNNCQGINIIQIGKKYGKSVQRNKIKRLLREAFALYGKDISPPATLLLIPKVRDSYSVSSFSKDLRYLFEKEKILDRTEGADRR